jgi:hypothetical protein
MSFSGLNQVLLPALDASPQLPAVHRNALIVALAARARRPAGSSCRTRRQDGLDGDLAAALESIDTWPAPW